MFVLTVLLSTVGLADDREVAFQIVDQMSAAEKRLVDSTYELHREEYVDGEFGAKQIMAVKYRRPHHVYIKWVGKTYGGREVIIEFGFVFHLPNTFRQLCLVRVLLPVRRDTA